MDLEKFTGHIVPCCWSMECRCNCRRRRTIIGGEEIWGVFESKEEGSEENKKTKLHGKWKESKRKEQANLCKEEDHLVGRSGGSTKGWGGDLWAGLYQMGFVALLTNAQCFSPEILRLFSRICPADDARTSNYYRIPFDNFCQNLLTVWEWKFFLRRRIWTFQSDVSIPGGWICHCSYSYIALNKFIPFQNFVNCSKKNPSGRNEGNFDDFKV